MSTNRTIDAIPAHSRPERSEAMVNPQHTCTLTTTTAVSTPDETTMAKSNGDRCMLACGGRRQLAGVEYVCFRHR